MTGKLGGWRLSPSLSLLIPPCYRRNAAWLDPRQSAARLDLHAFPLLLTASTASADEGAGKLLALHPIKAAFVVGFCVKSYLQPSTTCLWKWTPRFCLDARH